MNPFTRNFVCGRLDKETASALVSMESSYGFTIDVKFRGHWRFPWSWTIENKNDLGFAHSGLQETWKGTRDEMKSSVENILMDMGETKKSIVMKSRLRGGK